MLQEVAAAPAGAKDDKKEALPSVPSQLAALFPSEILIRPPQDETELDQWKRQLKKDSESMRADANRKMLRQVGGDSPFWTPGSFLVVRRLGLMGLVRWVSNACFR